jgi:hypothetical protein
MKTNQVMIRTMGTFKVEQRTKDGMFNATKLLTQWNSVSGKKKAIKDFLENQGTIDFIEVLNNEEFPNGGNSPYLATRGKHGGTWMHPVLFIKFAMWINPKFEYFVIRFVYDQLIEFRHLAGDQYRSLGRALARFEKVDYGRVAKGLNHIVFGTHQHELRQSASVQQLKSLSSLQEKLAFAINMGYIKSYDELISEMIRIYHVRDQYLAL